jgi:hypothetical protein
LWFVPPEGPFHFFSSAEQPLVERSLFSRYFNLTAALLSVDHSNHCPVKVRLREICVQELFVAKEGRTSQGGQGKEIKGTGTIG